jgi:hypothetical protein
MVLLHAIFLVDGIKECETIFVRLKQYFFLALALLHGQWLWLLAFYYYL